MQSSALINALWISLLGITVSVCTPLFQRWYVGDKIAFINTHFAENRPASNATRNRCVNG